MTHVPTFFAIVPAAGTSNRMGRPKLLLPWQGQTILEAVLAAWRASRVKHVVVVARDDDVELIRLCRAQGCDVVTPHPAPAEMTISVRHALAHLESLHGPSSQDAWLLAPADMPCLSTGPIDRLIAEHDPARPEILVAAFAGRPGHPVLFPWPLALEAQASRRPLNALAERHGRRLVECPDEPGVLDDVDSPADYEQLRRQRGESDRRC